MISLSPSRNVDLCTECMKVEIRCLLIELFRQEIDIAVKPISGFAAAGGTYKRK